MPKMGPKCQLKLVSGVKMARHIAEKIQVIPDVQAVNFKNILKAVGELEINGNYHFHETFNENISRDT